MVDIGEILKGKYKIEKLLGQGATGKVYLCRNIELGNLWAVKYIYKKHTKIKLLAEIDILKKLNHVSLPKIIDVIEDDSGFYMVESYIEGTPLDKLLKDAESFDEETVIEWAKQLCDALSYLHSMKPFPIIYRDMKPQNIIITTDNKAVIVDFGIAREYKGQNTKDTIIAGTPYYAAPEQLTAEGATDNRTDIYSLGVTLHHLLTGALPKFEETSLLEYDKNISPQMDYIILKCIKKNLSERYQSIDELKKDLNNIKLLKINSFELRIRNRLIISASILMSIISLSMVYLGISAISKEKSAVLDISPEVLALSQKQERPIKVKKKYTDGSTAPVRSNEIKWKSSNQDVAVVKNDRVYATGEGTADLEGFYEDKRLKMTVLVNKAADEVKHVDINLKYLRNYQVSSFAGNGNHTDINGDIPDGDLKNAIISDPCSISFIPNGDLLVTDQRKLRLINKNTVKTIDLETNAEIARISSNGTIYFSFEPYENENQEMIYGICSYKNGITDFIYKNSGTLKVIEDFAFDSHDNIYLLEHEFISTDEEVTSLVYLNTKTKEHKILKELPGFIDSITLDVYDNLFISSKENYSIYKLDKTSQNFMLFAGNEKEQQFVDGINCRFFAPKRIKAVGNNLYILDKNVLRRISLDSNGDISDVESIAGQPGKVPQNNNTGISQHNTYPGYYALFKDPSDFAIDKQGNIFVTDKKGYVIWKISSM
ncbi:serine/threonine-protein kinase [Pseudobacteroides cellulosolvens]|uniref:Serine/threonine protein kinase n=1 Tax=Pseudobacteroides cellulosolvens ATCC 35603 = DSM 2933 TaxID=398512 RepID=A0A0L6JNU5_9FIRM|nr:serine/threonine-protein kinase [Pseudobacteroides cellulosolvens]KNY27042.1 serine/threonine protein kinase [Pseudobacteroides cellulosolvens ATCC 35603 = DSM 2933]